MGILSGGKKRAVNKDTQTSVAKFNIPIIPDMYSFATLKPTACIKHFHTVLKRDKIFSIQNIISKETSGFAYFIVFALKTFISSEGH